MKSVKIIWYGAMAGFLSAGLFTGRREVFLVFFIMGFTALYAFALNMWTIFSFHFSQKLDEHEVVKGAEAMLRIAVHNEMLFPFTLMRLSVKTAVFSERLPFAFSLSPHAHIAYDIPLSCPYRGVFRVGIEEIEVNDSFGLVKTVFLMRRLPYYRPNELKVYPYLHELAALPAKHRDGKTIARRFTDDGDSFAGLRKYRPGDPLKRLHRVATARLRERMVKTYDLPKETAVRIVIDTHIAVDNEEGLLLADLACECAAAIAHYSLKTGYAVELAAQDTAETYETLRAFSRLRVRLTVMPFGNANKKERTGTPRLAPAGIRALYYITPKRADDVLSGYLREGYTLKALLILPAGGKAFAHGQSAKSAVGYVPIAVGDDVSRVLTEALETGI